MSTINNITKMLNRTSNVVMNILNIPSPNSNKGRKSYRPEAIVIHIMEGSLSGTDDWFRSTKSNVSAHYGIGKTGEVHRYVPEEA